MGQERMMAAMAICEFLESTDYFAQAELSDGVMLAIHYKQRPDPRIIKYIRDVFLPFESHKIISVSGLADDPRSLYEVSEVQNLAFTLGHLFPNLVMDPLLAMDSRRWLILSEAAYLGCKLTKEGPPEVLQWAQENQFVQPRILTKVEWTDEAKEKARIELLQAFSLCEGLDWPVGNVN